MIKMMVVTLSVVWTSGMVYSHINRDSISQLDDRTMQRVIGAQSGLPKCTHQLFAKRCTDIVQGDCASKKTREECESVPSAPICSHCTASLALTTSYCLSKSEGGDAYNCVNHALQKNGCGNQQIGTCGWLNNGISTKCKCLTRNLTGPCARYSITFAKCQVSTSPNQPQTP